MQRLFSLKLSCTAAGDVRMLVRGGVLGAKRIARYLWRMYFGLFIAAVSIFLAREPKNAESDPATQ
jgi:hypothetical protein